MILSIIVSLLKNCLQYKNLANRTENTWTANNLKSFSGTKLDERLEDAKLTTKAGFFLLYRKCIFWWKILIEK